MLSIGGEMAPSPSSEALERSEFPRIHQAHDSLLSPSIQRTAGETVPAFELKFLIPESLALLVEAWADQHLTRDAYADVRHGGAYQTTTLYLDTPNLDVFHRAPGFRRRKFRLRRYGMEQKIYLERKTRSGDRVKKRRSDVPLSDLARVSAEEAVQADGATFVPPFSEDWCGAWSSQRIAVRTLRPVCRITYDRTAFVKLVGDSPLRLTLDRRIRGMSTSDWNLTPIEQGHSILPGDVICEFKFRETLPGLFKDVITALQLETGSISKYRRMMTATGAMGDGSGSHA